MKTSPSITPSFSSFSPSTANTASDIQEALQGHDSQQIRQSVAAVLKLAEIPAALSLSLQHRAALILYLQQQGVTISPQEAKFVVGVLYDTVYRGLATQIIYYHTAAHSPQELPAFVNTTLTRINTRSDYLRPSGIGLPKGDYRSLIERLMGDTNGEFYDDSSFERVCHANIKLAQLLLIEADEQLALEAVNRITRNIRENRDNQRSCTAVEALFYIIENSQSPALIKACIDVFINKLGKLLKYQYKQLLTALEYNEKLLSASQLEQLRTYFSVENTHPNRVTFPGDKLFQQFAERFGDGAKKHVKTSLPDTFASTTQKIDYIKGEDTNAITAAAIKKLENVISLNDYFCYNDCNILVNTLDQLYFHVDQGMQENIIKVLCDFVLSDKMHMENQQKIKNVILDKFESLYQSVPYTFKAQLLGIFQTVSAQDHISKRVKIRANVTLLCWYAEMQHAELYDSVQQFINTYCGGRDRSSYQKYFLTDEFPQHAFKILEMSQCPRTTKLICQSFPEYFYCYDSNSLWILNYLVEKQAQQPKEDYSTEITAAIKSVLYKQRLLPLLRILPKLNNIEHRLLIIKELEQRWSLTIDFGSDAGQDILAQNWPYFVNILPAVSGEHTRGIPDAFVAIAKQCDAPSPVESVTEGVGALKY